jgi:hypothetical protein
MLTLFFDKVLKIYDGENIASSTNVVGKNGYPVVKNETRSMFISL